MDLKPKRFNLKINNDKRVLATNISQQTTTQKNK